MTTLMKRSPLAPVYRSAGARIECMEGWEIATDFGDPAAEARALAEGSALVDWSLLGKIRIRGRDAADCAERLLRGAGGLAPLRAASEESLALLRLAQDEFLALCQPHLPSELLGRLGQAKSAVHDCSGALGALLLAGAGRHRVIERSAAMDLSARALGPGSALQTTLHTIPCTVYRARDWDLYLQTRDYSESLYHALMDVGSGVGLVAAGLACVPIDLCAGGSHA